MGREKTKIGSGDGMNAKIEMQLTITMECGHQFCHSHKGGGFTDSNTPDAMRGVIEAAILSMRTANHTCVYHAKETGGELVDGGCDDCGLL
jgi:hypothetical protein